MNRHPAFLLRCLCSDERGAVAIYVTLLIGLLVGMTGLVIDGGRLFTTNTHARSAADAAALAGASQLDGGATAIERAKAAAQGALVKNEQTFATSEPTVAIPDEGIRFLHSLPADNQEITAAYVTTDPREARFIEVTTQSLVQDNLFVQALGAEATSDTAGTAVAGFTQVVCQVAPLAMCNPAEQTQIGANFDVEAWRGRQILLKASGAGAAWTPGDFGLVDVDGSQSAPEIAGMLASAQPSACVAARVDLKPGQTQGARNAFNTRFDMYGPPFFGGNARNNPLFRPARNVTKGLVKQGGSCNDVPPDPPELAATLGRDTVFENGRFGNGVWDCQAYWEVNHPGETAPAGCTSAPSSMTRYELYRHEVDNDIIPDNSATGGENGAPQCHADSATTSDNPDRRILYFAVINCIEQGPISGNSAGPIDVEAFVKGFITEPVGAPPDTDLYVEVVDIARPGDDDGVLHDLVQLYR